MEKKLYRLKTDRKIAGVCSGFALYLNVDTTIIRVLWVLLSLFWFSGIVLYIACMFIIPEEPDYFDVSYKEK